MSRVLFPEESKVLTSSLKALLVRPIRHGESQEKQILSNLPPRSREDTALHYVHFSYVITTENSKITA